MPRGGRVKFGRVFKRFRRFPPRSATLAATVAKNWLFHGVEIKKDIADEQADYAKKDYYAAGQDTAAALLRLIPMSTEEAFLQ